MSLCVCEYVVQVFPALCSTKCPHMDNKTEISAGPHEENSLKITLNDKVLLFIVCLFEMLC